jgi:GNAT superfamily N-acetyltransferase
VRALAAVHAVDGYPTVWPVAPAAWLSPPCLTRAWVAGHRGDVAGHVAMVRGADEPAVTALTGTGPDGLARVTRLFVAPAARGRRLGARLLDAVRDHAGELGLVPVLDVVDDGGAAVALYDRLGWRLVDRRPADWTTPAGVRLPVRLYLAPGSPST